MSIQKIFTGKELISILVGMDFAIIRIKGSHHFLQHPDGRATVIPIHSGEQIGIGLFMKILKDIEMSRNEFNSLNN